MRDVQKSLYKDYEELLIKNDKLSKENRSLKYINDLLLSQISTLEKKDNENVEELKRLQEETQEKDYEIARLKALLNMDGTNHGIPTSQTPINKKKVIPNTRPETERTRGGQKGHPKHKLEKFEEEEITEYSEHQMKECPCCNGHKIEATGEVKEKD